MKKELILMICFVLASLCPLNSFAARKVAKVIMVRGNVFVQDASTRVFKKLGKGRWLNENAKIKTSKRSIVKLLFIDKSQLTLGPNSEMKINRFPKNKVGMLTLLKGKMQTKVMKSRTGDNKDKLYIKTPSAALGVRGTDFIVMHNPHSKRSSTLAFSGRVSFAQIPKRAKRKARTNIRKLLSGDKAVMVRRGQYSGSSNKLGRANIPIRISPSQFSILKRRGIQTGKTNRKKKIFRSPVPSGISSRVVVTNGENVSKTLGRVMGGGRVKGLIAKAKNKIEKEMVKSDVRAEGMFNKNTGEFAPKNGGIVNLDTGTYYAPPAGSVLDPTTGTYQIPATHGGIDANGRYMPPEGYQVTKAGTVKKDELVSGPEQPSDKPVQPSLPEPFPDDDLLPPPPDEQPSPLPEPEPPRPPFHPFSVIGGGNEPDTTTEQNSFSRVIFNITVQ